MTGVCVLLFQYQLQSNYTGTLKLLCMLKDRMQVLCDAIKGNQPEVKHVTLSVFYLIEVLIRRGKIQPESDQWFQSYSNWKILKTIENKRIAFLFLPVSHNQCSRLPTDPARSQHILLLSSRHADSYDDMCMLESTFWKKCS